MSASNNQIVWHPHAVNRGDRERLLQQRGCVIWLTGLSGCGKSTIANELDRQLFDAGVATFLLDGDNIRHGLCAGPDRLVAEHGETFAQRFGLGFTAADREENIRRIGCVAELLMSAGLITVTAFVSPYLRDRQRVRSRIEAAGQAGDFVEVFVDTPLEECEKRDPKGLYKQARAGKIANFTGISDPYEAPSKPEIHCQTVGRSPQECARAILLYLQERGFIRAESA